MLASPSLQPSLHCRQASLWSHKHSRPSHDHSCFQSIIRGAKIDPCTVPARLTQVSRQPTIDSTVVSSLLDRPIATSVPNYPRVRIPLIVSFSTAQSSLTTSTSTQRLAPPSFAASSQPSTSSLSAPPSRIVPIRCSLTSAHAMTGDCTDVERPLTATAGAAPHVSAPSRSSSSSSSRVGWGSRDKGLDACVATPAADSLHACMPNGVTHQAGPSRDTTDGEAHIDSGSRSTLRAPSPADRQNITTDSAPSLSTPSTRTANKPFLSALPSLPGLPPLSSSLSPTSSPRSSSRPSSPSKQPPPPLPSHLDPTRLPAHVAIILDGNSRWAKARGLPQTAGHEAGVRALRETVRTAAHWGVQALTVFAFSTENWERPKGEVAFLMSLLQRMLEEEVEELHSQGVAVRVIGDLQRLSPSLQRCIQGVHERTRGNTSLKLNIAVSYSGRQDIVTACQCIAAQAAAGEVKPSEVTEDLISSQLATAWLGPELANPDLLIRTSGESRISNFLLWQMAYTEMHFCSTLWPDFGVGQLAEALAEYQRRDRRFGRRERKEAGE